MPEREHLEDPIRLGEILSQLFGAAPDGAALLVPPENHTQPKESPATPERHPNPSNPNNASTEAHRSA
ncbi:hypothetical protein JOE65_000709 [Arthrobacter roseus]|nr:hypothetical protein [Arthrobacter roseus]